MYGVYDFGLMLADRVRTDAYCQALRKAITPGCTVLEIGTGTGLFAMLARRWGAGTVFAVEVLDTIDLAPQIAEANGLAEGIEFIKGFSTRLELPERADVLISDLRGTLPLYRMHLPSIMDARDRLLSPGGTQIPQADTIRGAVVEAPAMYRRPLVPWETDRFDIDHSQVNEISVNTWRRWHKEDMGECRALTEPTDWATIDYQTVQEAHQSGVLEWKVERAGTAHGLNLWFDATLLGEIGYSTSPDGPGLVYGNAFFPLKRPVDVSPGDEVRCSLRADLIAGRYVWTWGTEIRYPDSDPVVYEQSTFFSASLGPRDVAVQESGHVPNVSLEGRVLRAALELMDGTRTVEEIASELERSFPSRFDRWDTSVGWVRQLSRDYSD